MIWSDFEFVIHLACIIKPCILDIIWPCLLIIMIMTWLFSGILFICALVVSFAARARSARAANDTTRAQINNIPEKSHVIPLLKYMYYGVGTSTVEPRLSGPRLSGFLDYPDFFSGPNLVDYLLVTIKIRIHILFKTTALKGAVKSELILTLVKCKGFFLLSKSKGSARACRKEGDIGIFGFAVLAIF